MTDFRAGAGKIRMTLEHLVVPEHKEVLKKTKMMGPCQSVT